MGFSVIPEPAISGFTGPQGPAGTIAANQVIDGGIGVNDTTGDPNIDIKKNGSLRWKIRSAGTESGSNNGSDLWVEAFADDGTTKINDPIWISRTGGQVVIGQADSAQGGVRLSVNGAIGTRDLTADPATTSMGAQLYSKSGKLWVQTGSGAEKFQVVESLPSKANATLSATYMSIDKSAGNYRVFRWLTDGVSRWEAQVDDVAEAGSAVGSDFRLSARNDDGSFNKTVIHAKRSDGTITFGTTTHHGTAQVTSAGAVGLRDIATDPATATGGVFLYSKGGLPYIKQGDGAAYSLTPPSSFTPESLGVLAWAGDPGTLASGSDYSGVGQGRMTAVYVSRTTTVSKIVWHMQGYAGGLLTGSWAGIYDTAGTLKGATGDMSTATYEPATQSVTAGGWSSAPLTASVTLSPGVYYVCWRFSYTASPVDGPALARWDSTSTTNGLMGLGTSVWRFAKFTSSATTAPSTITPSSLFSANGIQFWVALA